MDLITKNITRLVCLGLLMTLIITSVFLIGSEVMERKIKTQKEYSLTYTELINLTAITQEMRRREKDFFLRKNIIYAKQYDNLYQEAMTHIAEVKELGASKTFAADLAKLSDLLQKHHKEFASSVQTQQDIGFDLDKGIQGNMRNIIHHLEDILVYQIKDKQLTILLFTIRRNEKNFLLKMQSMPDQPTPEVAEEFIAYLKNLQINQNLKNETLVLLNKYLDEFKTLVAKEAALSQSVSSLTSIFTDFEHIHYQLLNQSRARAQDSYDQAIHYLHTLRVIMGVFGVLMLLTIGIYGIILRRRFLKQ